MLETIKVFFLAIVQGIGEFLPISSSGHLLVLGNLLFGGSDIEDELGTLGILLHTGTLLSILIIFRRQIWEMLSDNRRLMLLIIVASIPTGIFGIIIHKYFNFLEQNVLIAGIGFLLTAWLLFNVIAPKKKSDYERYFDEIEELSNEENELSTSPPLKTLKTMTYRDAFIVGCFQTIAILPGCSRSGFTISAGILRRLNQDAAASFSFLIALPAIAGATLLEVLVLWKDQGPALLSDPNMHIFLLGSLVSFGVGLVSLIFLLKWLKEGRLQYFGYWLLILGPAVVAWQLWEIISSHPFINEFLMNFLQK
ncbi:MAG: undecaprenyl-diphosphate phosphatase [Planctomycetia bacterium]|nr:undecaprenyl-diphosphate phosphatase [Planctomycetia bacterium]